MRLCIERIVRLKLFIMMEKGYTTRIQDDTLTGRRATSPFSLGVVWSPYLFQLSAWQMRGRNRTLQRCDEEDEVVAMLSHICWLSTPEHGDSSLIRIEKHGERIERLG